MSDIDEEPTAEEIAEAERLADALEGRRPGGDPPDDALGPAALLRFATGASALGEDRRDAVIEQALSEAKAPRPARSRARLVLGALMGALAAGAAAATVVWIGSEPKPTALPLPPAALLEAQASVAAGGDPQRLDDAMKAFRSDVYAVLEDRYRR